MTRSLLAAALAGGLMMALTVPQPAAAVPVAKAPMQTSGGVMLARHGGPGGFHGRGGAGAFHGFRGGNFVHRARPNFGGNFNHRGGRSHHHGSRYRFYPRYYGYSGYGYADTYYPDECAWLRRRALATGSRYWWRRYALCREDY